MEREYHLSISSSSSPCLWVNGYILLQSLVPRKLESFKTLVAFSFCCNRFFLFFGGGFSIFLSTASLVFFCRFFPSFSFFEVTSYRCDTLAFLLKRAKRKEERRKGREENCPLTEPFHQNHHQFRYCVLIIFTVWVFEHL